MLRPSLTAVLGPTNTGKTHLAIERLCAHSSGMMGFPLRLLAREVYDRVRAIKGDASVALITGEEKIAPPDAKWLICTVESMPIDRDVAFVAIDEAQLGADPERGHVFTDRLLHARGREETMILGSATLAPLVKALLPEAEIIKRPRFSELSYIGPKRLSRLPKRSAIVAFSAEEVYGIAETIRRSHGGAAVVMGALSPRTRNAQVAMFEAGEVDYLVATDAIGMGLNLDLGHVAFASLSKFDGKRQRRLHPTEMAQIAGRAGRHQRNGTFGILAANTSQADFTEAEIERIEHHRFAPLDHLWWRNADLEFSGIDALLESLELPSAHIQLRAAPESTDVAALKTLSTDSGTRLAAGSPDRLQLLWEVCGLPDFRQTGPEYHARLVGRLFAYLASPAGVIPDEIIANELKRLDNIQGDIGTLTGRIAAARTWSYVSQRSHWLRDPAHWAGRTSELDQNLSDALHDRLTQRFVDRRTTLLMRSAGSPMPARLVFEDEGPVSLDGEPLGWLRGFDFQIDPAASVSDRKMMSAAVERQLPAELARRALALVEAPDREFALVAESGAPVELTWRGWRIARLKKGRDLLEPALELPSALRSVTAELRRQIDIRLAAWIARQISMRLAPLQQIRTIASDPETPSPVRALAATLFDASGHGSRLPLEAVIQDLAPKSRQCLRKAGIVIGTLDIFHHGLLKPEATRLRLALLAIRKGQPMPPLPMPGLTLLDRPSPELAASAAAAGYRRFGDQFVRIDLVERIARALHDQRRGKSDFVPDTLVATQIGVGEATTQRIMRALGFTPTEKSHPRTWRWRGQKRVAAGKSAGNPSFAPLKDWPSRGQR